MSAAMAALRGVRSGMIVALLVMAVSGLMLSACGQREESGTLSVSVLAPAGPFASAKSREPWPMDGETITVNRGDEQVASGATSADGTVTFSLPPGEYTVRDSGDCEDPKPVRITQGQVAEVKFVCNRL
ncbi:MAG: hypothetical protein U0904_10795 [Candidatus Nanopelagicales bacterium]|nr:hypothetical protein [Candidatus Nanopelagicales bacterium]